MTGSAVYQPQAVDIPLINKKNDLRIDAGISNLTSANATISYGLTDKVAVQTFGSYQSGERYYFQGAIGLYKKQNIQQVMEWYGELVTDRAMLIMMQIRVIYMEIINNILFK